VQVQKVGVADRDGSEVTGAVARVQVRDTVLVQSCQESLVRGRDGELMAVACGFRGQQMEKLGEDVGRGYGTGRDACDEPVEDTLGRVFRLLS
jgi:hypothetical protein